MLSRLKPDWKHRLTFSVTLLLAVLFIHVPLAGEGEISTKELEPPQERQILKMTASVKAEKYIPPPSQPNPPLPSVVIPVGKETIVKLIQARFGTDPRILALVSCESKFSTSIVSPVDRNGYVNVGLFQINMTRGQTIDYWKNVHINIQKAWELSNGGTNFYPWPTCGKSVGLF